MKKIELIKSDITTLNVDAIVNAANSSLLGGGGVDGAIHEAAGEELLEKCKKLNGCNTGEAKITKGYNLSANYIIHTVGPVWVGGKNNEDKYLASCYKNSLDLAIKNNIKTIAFPNISTGIYGFPKNRAAIIAVHAVELFLKEHNQIDKVIFVAFDDENYSIYEKLLK
ncbi:MAG: O-acetyl-ADP-ribose deacetylase [Bacteroidia bacterium]|nr:O-acetyl-ADP-ribose deacetylase [Bacteroidia bacterium]